MSMAASAFMYSCVLVCAGVLLIGVCAKRAGTRTFSNEISFVECSDSKMIFANHEMMSDHGAIFFLSRRLSRNTLFD